MWTSKALDISRGAYQAARSDDIRSDDSTLADEGGTTRAEKDDTIFATEDGTSLAPDQSTFHDPRDEENADKGHTKEAAAYLSSIRWVKFVQSLRWWKPRSNTTVSTVEPQLTGTVEEATIDLVSGSSTSPRWAAASRQMMSWLVWPLPSYTHRYFIKDLHQEEAPRRSTDYLDGLRGVASLFVFVGHFMVDIKRDTMHHGYASSPKQWDIMQLPFIRVVYSGPAMVEIFFVISGYVLTHRCIIVMRAGRQDKLFTALTSMSFRRAIRLFLPSLIASACGLGAILLGLLPPQHPKNWTFEAELRNFAYHMNVNLFRLFDWTISIGNYYAFQLWTIPFEFRASMVIFIFSLATARCTVCVRSALEGVSIAYLYASGRWDVALFFAGMAIAELNIMVDERKKRKAERRAVAGEASAVVGVLLPRLKRWCSQVGQFLLWIMLFLGWYLTGYPVQDAIDTPGYGFLAYLIDSDRFWLGQAAIIICLATSFLPAVQAFFSTAIARYLGKISYALYLVHVVMNKTLRNVLWHFFWDTLEYKMQDGDTEKFEDGWIFGGLIFIPCVLWAADIFWRAVDAPSVRFARWIEEKCFVANKV